MKTKQNKQIKALTKTICKKRSLLNKNNNKKGKKDQHTTNIMDNKKIHYQDTDKKKYQRK